MRNVGKQTWPTRIGRPRKKEGGSSFSPPACFHVKISRGVAFAAAIAFLMLSTLCRAESGEKKAGKKEGENLVIARVNGAAISSSDLMVEVNRKLPFISFHGNIRPEKMDRLVKESLEELILQELKFQEARKRNLKVPKKQIDRRIEEKIKKKFPSEKAFQEALKKAGVTMSDLEKRMEKELLAEKIEELEVTEKTDLTDRHLEQYYLANRAQFVQPESVHLEHILIEVDPSSPPQGWEEGRKQAQALLDRIQKGEAFEKVARQYAQGGVNGEGTEDLGFVHRGRLQPEIEQVAFSLREGKIGGPIRTIYGFHLIKVVEKRPQRQLAFSEIDREAFRRELTESEIERRREAWIQGLKEKAQIERIGKLSVRPPSPTHP